MSCKSMAGTEQNSSQHKFTTIPPQSFLRQKSQECSSNRHDLGLKDLHSRPRVLHNVQIRPIGVRCRLTSAQGRARRHLVNSWSGMCRFARFCSLIWSFFTVRFSLPLTVVSCLDLRDRTQYRSEYSLCFKMTVFAASVALEWLVVHLK